MNSYYDDDPPYRPQGRVPIPGGGEYDPNDPYEPPGSGDFDPFAPSYNDQYDAPPPPPPPAPPATSGRASVGRASIRPSDFEPGGYEPNDYGYGSGAPDSGMHDGFDPFAADGPAPAFDPFAPQAPPSSGSSGRASVPGAAGGGAAAGRASVGRASVGVGPGGPGGPGGPAGPGGPTGPGGRDGKGKGKPVNKKRRRRNRILAAFATVIMLSGILVVTITYYAASIPTPDKIQLPQATTIEYSNGKELAQIGQFTRKIIPLSQVPKPVQDAVIATEDATFYSNSGIDMKGIARALVNNATGGSTQGASTITQQYARTVVAGVGKSDTYSRKLKEAIVAVKLTQKYSKDYILEAYLNSVPFGRGAYGIEAAAEAYFNKPVEKLSQADGIVLADLIKDPEGNLYDPACKCATAQQRFQYSRGQLLSHKFINQQQYDSLKYPTDWVQPKKDDATNQNMATPLGFIVHHVMSELSAMKASNGQPLFPSDGANSLLNGGYTIVTTINQAAEAAAIDAAGGGKDSPVRTVYGVDSKGKRSKDVAAALVAVEPGSGRVIAYYGGQNGANMDFGGIYNDPVMAGGGWSGNHVTPGSTFKTITMATALSQGISIDSLWYGPTSRTFKGRAQPVTNSAPDACPGSAHICPMWQALQHSTNTVYYAIGQAVHPDKIIDMAQELGINNLWSDVRCKGKRIDLTPNDGASLYPSCIGGEIAFGQFGVTVQDVANVMATFAAHGVKSNEHFVKSVTQGYDNVPKYRERIVQTQVPNFKTPQADDETWAMEQVYQRNKDEQNNHLANGREAAVKTGTWQLGDSPNDAAQSREAMFNGFTAGTPAQGQIACSVWVGYSQDQMAVFTKNSNGTSSKIGGAGTPAAVWAQFMDAYEKGKPLETFAPAAKTGNPLAGETTAPTPPPPSAPPTQPPPGGPVTPPPASQPPQQPTPLTASANVNNQMVQLTWDNSGGGNGQGPVRIDWGDGATQPGKQEETQGLQHKYNNPGTYTIKVTDLDNPSRTASVQVTINP